MSGNDYGNLGNEMKNMKDGRASLMAGIKNNRERIQSETGRTLAAAEKFVVETGQDNEKLAGRTRQMMAQAQRDLKMRTRRMLADAKKLAATIRKDVAALKADVGQILADADGFLARTGSDNAMLKGQTHKMLARARSESKAGTRRVMAKAGKVMVQTKAAVAGIRTETGRVLADAADVMKRLCGDSRKRADGWRDVIGTVHGGGLRVRSGTTAAGRPAPVKLARKATPKRIRKSVKKQGRKVA